MPESITYWAHWIITHVPMLTWVGLCIAAVFGLAYLTRRSKPCAMLACVAAVYAITPYLPHLAHS